HQWAKANPRRRKNITPPSRIPWEHANAAESLLAHRSTTGKSWSRGVRLYLGHIRNRDWEGKESNFEDYPEDSKKARRMLLREVDRIRKGGSPHLYKWAKANPPGEMGKWKKTADGYYLPGQAVSFLVKKEAIKARGRRKQMWALYANRHEDAREKGWKLWLNNIPTLTKAKGIARDYVGDDSGKKRNPRRRKNARWPEKIGRYKLKMQKSEGYGDDDATYGPFRIVHQVYVPSPSDWHARPQPDTWKVTLGDWDDPYTEYLGTYSSRDSAISTLRSHLREGRGRSPTKEYKYRVRVSIGPSGNLTEIGRKAALESLKRMGKPAKFSFVMESRWGRVKQAAESELERQTGHRWTLHGGKQGKGGSQVFEVYTSGWLGGTVTIEDAASKAAKGRIRTVARRENVAFGKGKPERNHPYANILRSEGLTYSHSVPVNHSGVKVFHHVYRLDGTDFYVSYYQEPLGTKWLWEGSVSGSGRMHQGFGMSKLNKYLRGAVPRHRTKAAREREAYEHSSAIMSGFSPPSPRRRR
ncbi:MAG: hypothetical protein KAJ42_14585, partial [Gemmatimonadetes bacterium]|nr:hypothetical protein [Gemmatimonadota bacterium]